MPTPTGTVDIPSATTRIKAVLDSLWSGEFPSDMDSERWVIEQLRASLGELASSWQPPPYKIRTKIKII